MSMLTLKPWLAMSLAILCLSGGGAPVTRAQERSGGAASLTPLDYYEIQQLFARYAHWMDTGASNGYTAADLFTPDGVYVDATGERIEGWEKLTEMARRDPDARKGSTNVSQFVANVVLEPAQSGAIGRSYILFAAKPLPGQPRGIVTDGGQYWDDLVRTPPGWRLRRRVFVRSGSAVASLPPLQPMPAGRGTGEAGPSSPAFRLTADDYAGIYRLYADYGYTFDTGSEKGYGWGNLYTPDGVHVSVVNSLEYIKGRDLLAAFAYGSFRGDNGFWTLDPARAPSKTTISIAHIQPSILLEPTQDGVVGKPYRLTGARSADGRFTLTPGGVYYDLLVKDPDRWRYKASWYLLPGLKVPDVISRFITPTRLSASAPAPPMLAGAQDLSASVSTADDVEIHQLYARSARAFDSGAENGNAYARLFTPNGVFVDETGRTYAGHDALAALARGTGTKNQTNTEQFIWQVKIDPSATGARGKAYVVVANLAAPGTPIMMVNGGQYRDDLVKTPTGWRISRRTFYRIGSPGQP